MYTLTLNNQQLGALIKRQAPNGRVIFMRAYQRREALRQRVEGIALLKRQAE